MRDNSALLTFLYSVTERYWAVDMPHILPVMQSFDTFIFRHLIRGERYWTYFLHLLIFNLIFSINKTDMNAIESI